MRRKLLFLTMMAIALPLWAGGFTPSILVNDDGDRRVHHDLYSTGQQVIATLGDLVFLTWSDNRYGDRDVFFVVSPDRGTTWGSNVRVNDTTPGDGSFQANPSFVVDDSGTIYVVWSDDRSGTPQIYFSSSLDGGLSFTPNYPILTTVGQQFPQEFPTLAIDSQGTLYVAWQEPPADGSTPPRIHFSKSLDGGLTWTRKRQVDPNPLVATQVTVETGAQRTPSMKVDDAGNVYLSWTDLRRGNPDIFFARSTDAGDTWQPSVWVTSDFKGGNFEMHPSLGVDGAGNIYIAFTHGDVYDINVARSNDGGATWKSARVDDTTGPYVGNLNPGLSVNTQGDVVVVWADSRNSHWVTPPRYKLPVWLQFRSNYDIYLGISRDGGRTFRNFRVSDSRQNDFEFFPTVTIDDMQNVYVAWQGLTQGVNDVYFSRRDR